MGPFSASLRVPGDTGSLAATLLVEDGRLRITAGDQPIGDWSFGEIELQATGLGFRMIAEGEQLLIDVDDVARFEQAVAEASKPPKKFKRFRREKRPRHSRTAKSPKVRKTSRREERAGAAPTVEEAREGGTSRFLDWVDAVIAKAERKFGSLMPRWVFNRITPMAFLALVGVSIGFPGVAANIFLLGGLVLSAFGAALFLDSHLAVRLLPGRSTPKHVLLLGLLILLIGVLMAFAVG